MAPAGLFGAHPRSIVTLADEQVPITTVCRLVGVDLPEDADYGRSVKVRCPFGEIYHSDHGVEPAMRLYLDDNAAYCFRCARRFTPVKLASHAWDVRYHVAAARLLDHLGIKPVDQAHRWAEFADPPNPPQPTMLAEALKTYCHRIDPQWPDHQFQPTAAGQLDRCLALLDHVHTDEQARAWLDGCKQAMRHVLQPNSLGGTR